MKEIGVKPRKLLSIRIVEANAMMEVHREKNLIKDNKEGTLCG